MPKSVLKQICGLSAALWLVAGCSADREPCLQPRFAALKAGTYRTADTGTALVDSVLPNPIVRPLDAQEPVAYYYGQPTSKFGWRLSQLADSSRFLIQTDSAVTPVDTLTVFYNRRTQFISQGCGFATYFAITGLRYTRNELDSAFITNPDVNEDANVEHLRLRY